MTQFFINYSTLILRFLRTRSTRFYITITKNYFSEKINTKLVM